MASGEIPKTSQNNQNKSFSTEDTIALEAGKRLAKPELGEEVVISGLSGRYPYSDDVYQFRDNLLNKVDMVTDDTRRWKYIHPEIPKRSGKLNDITRFDSPFFGVYARQGHTMDPGSRNLLEATVEAVLDAGINPSELRGSKTGVIVGFSASESEKYFFYERPHELNSCVVTGCAQSLYPNRVSLHLGLNGPSYSLDTACSSSSYALEHGYKAIRDGLCDNCIVAGLHMCLDPHMTLQFSRLGVLSTDGASKSFNVLGNGYVRSEAVCAVFLQKAKDARRVYAKVMHAKVNCDGFKEEGINFPSKVMQSMLFEEFYRECGVNPATVSFVEAHATGTHVGDPEEVAAIDAVFCSARQGPLLIGSVKSNMGHSEPASGLCSLSKVVIAMESGFIPPNLHFLSPRQGVEALEKGRLVVVTEKTPWQGDDVIVAMNSFGFGGANAHILLQWNKKQKIKYGLPKDDLPRLICVSGRMEQSVSTIFDDVSNRQLDAEFIALIHRVFRYNIHGHKYRGYSVVAKTGELSRSLRSFDEETKPLYFVFGGLNFSCLEVCSRLFAIPLFAATVQKIHDVLLPKGLNVKEMIANYKHEHSENIVHNILGNVVLHIAIADILKELEIFSEKVIGFSVGELTSAYVDGSLNLEETVLAAYYLGVALETNMKNGCNAIGEYRNNCTGAKFSQCFKKSIPQLKSRSDKWLPLPENSNDIHQNGSHEYLCSKIIHAVKSTQKIQKNLVLLEIGSAFFKNNSKSSLENILTIHLVENSVGSLLTGLGRLYEAGYNPKLDKLYPPVQWPVSRGTPMISPLIKWDHSKEWFAMKFSVREGLEHSYFRINVKEEEWSYLTGHVIDGRNLFPATGYLYLAWKSLSAMLSRPINNMRLLFENVKFIRATNIPKSGTLDFEVMIQKGSGHFEVTEGGVAVVIGRVSIPEDFSKEMVTLPSPTIGDGTLIPLKEKDIYKELRLRRYNYTGLFRSAKLCDNEAKCGYILWEDNWVSFMDNLLQMQILQVDTRNLYVPTRISRLYIDAKKHLEQARVFEKNNEILFPVHVFKEATVIQSGAIEIRGLVASAIPRRKPLGEPVLETYKFVPNDASLSTKESVRVNMQILLENLLAYKIKAVELIDDSTKEGSEPLGPLIQQVLEDQPLVQADILLLCDKPLDVQNVKVENKTLATESNSSLFVATNILKRPKAELKKLIPAAESLEKMGSNSQGGDDFLCPTAILYYKQKVLREALETLKENAFILTRENLEHAKFDVPGIDILTIHTTPLEKLVLFRKSLKYQLPAVVDITDSLQNFDWLPILQKAVKSSPNVIVLSQNDLLNGIIGLVNCVRREPGGEHVKCIGIFGDAPKFDANNEFYKKQIAKNLAVNIYKDGKWGTYRHLLLEDNLLVESEHCYVNLMVRGDLSSLRWIEGPLTSQSQLEPEKSLVHVYYSALNFRDIMTATGRIEANVGSRIEQECNQGMEYSGKDPSGKRVMGMTSRKAIATLLEADSYMSWTVPDEWSLEDAATVPLVYSTVIYAMIIVGEVRRGKSILVHAGTGGVGQAAISLALHYGCTVFTTVGTKEKKEFIKQHFPEIPDNHIGNSRDTSFEEMVMKETNGRGVDYVLNSLAEEKLGATVRCVARRGKFLEIGKFDLESDNALALELFSKHASFHGVMLDGVIIATPDRKRHLHNEFVRALKAGAIRPLTRTVFDENELEPAFRYMAAGKHVGKVLIKIREEEIDKLSLPSLKIMKGIPRYSCNPSKSYIITGGLGGFGLELTDWLVLRGARKLVLTSTRGVKTGYQDMRIRTWKSYGVEIVVSTASITTKEGCTALIKEAEKLGPVDGIYNLAVILKDAVLENQTQDNFMVSFAPKAIATKNLDEISRDLCPDLRDFVVFSSVSCGRGNAGQTNYGMANSIMERICEQRKKDNFSGLAIQWGAVGEVGLVAEMQEEHTELEIGGTLQQRISSCLDVLNILLKKNEPVVSSMVVAEKLSGTGDADNIVDAVVNILGIRDKKTVSLHSTLAELGMDSMMTVEIKQTLEREFEVFLTAQDMRSMTFARLQELALEREANPNSEATIHEQKTVLQAQEQLLFKHIGEEKMSTVPVVRLKTLVAEEIEAPTVLLLPGIEGMSTIFEILASRLHAHAVCLQLHYDHVDDTIPGTAKSLFPYALQHIQKSKPFTIIAYSFGCPIAVELVQMFEKEGLIGNLILIDGSHTMIRHLFRDLQVDQEAVFQAYLLGEIMSRYSPQETVLQCQSEMLRCKDFDERINIVLKNVPENVRYSKDYQKRLCVGIYMRINALIQHKPTSYKLKSRVVLYRPTQHAVIDIPEDYELSDSTEKRVEVTFFDGNHNTVLENTKLPDTINNLLYSNGKK